MTKPSQRAAAAAVLLSLGAAVYWWGEEAEQTPSPRPVAAASKAAPTPATTNFRPMAAVAQRGVEAPGAPAPVADRFAACPVLEERQTSRQENGTTKISRLRLVRQDDFKYPIVRVADELISTPQGTRLARQTAMVGDHVLIKMTDPKMDEAALLKHLKDAGATIRRKLPSSGNWLVAFPNPTVDTVPKGIAQLSALKPLVRYAEPDYLVHALVTPNDAGFSNLWGLHNTGQSGGVADVDIDAPEAWNLTKGSAAVVVAVIDSGIDHTHPDLMDNLWTNPAEIAGNGVDDDNNGYVDDLRGWDFVANDATPNDDNSHGTHCAGTIGAVGNNSTGVAGVCWDVSIVALKFLNAAGNGSTSDGVEAISYATELGVTLTSNSWGGGEYSQAMKDAIDSADGAGILFVVAAGNDSTNMEFFPSYPASYPSPNLISVAALTRTDSLASYSNFGLTTTDLGAPGSDIYSTLPGGGYGLKSGTSMAAPHVAGACALLKAHRPQLQHAQIKDLLLQTADSTPALTGLTVTGGRLNVFNALMAADDILVMPGVDLAATGSVGGPFTPASKTYTATNHSNSTAPWTAAVNQPWVNLSATGGTLAPGASVQVSVTINTAATALLPGDHTAAVTFTNTVTGRSQSRQIALRILPPPLYAFPLNSDPGWARTGQWAFGTPTGGGGVFYGRPDPAAGATGSAVFGINLSGDYSSDPGAAQYLTAGPFDLSSHHSTALRFQRWLNSDYQPWVYATVEVSTDLVNWHPVWDNGVDTKVESQWTEVSYDISEYADGHSQVYVRWGHQVRGLAAYPFTGWNVDDIEILAVPDRQLHLALPKALTEGGASGQGKVSIHPVLDTDLQVTLASDRPGEEASFPTLVVIPAHQESVTFTVTPLDDSLLDGTQSVSLTASAPNYPSHSVSLSVHDNEAGHMTVLLPAAVTEGAQTEVGVGQVVLTTPPSSPVMISLKSGDESELTVPVAVTVPAGELNAVIPFTVIDDIYIDGTQPVTVTATVMGWEAASASVNVLDNEPRALAVTVPATALENAGVMVNAAIVSSAAPVENDTVVNLSSTDTTEVTVPVVAVIPARSFAAVFSLTVQNDSLLDGPQTAQINAASPGFTAASATITILDDEKPSAAFNPSPPHGATGLHPETDLAWQVDTSAGGTPGGFDIYFGASSQLTGADLIGSTSTLARSLPRLTPGATYYWQIVSRKGSATTPGPVWSFTVAPVGPAKRLVWEALPPVVGAGAAFHARITAYDEHDNPATSFAGSTSLTPVGGGPESITGSGTIGWEFPLASYFQDARTQSIYLPAEVGPAGGMTSVALDVTTLPKQLLKNFTIRLKHTTKSLYADNGQRNWENTGWTTVYQKDTTVSSIGWNWFVFTAPFTYDGTSNLMVDISFNNNSYSQSGICRATPASQNRSLYYLTDSNFGDPLTWVNTVPFGTMSMSLPNLRFRRSETSIPITPSVAGPFVNGAWSGQLTLDAPGTFIRIQAQTIPDVAITGLSGSVDVVSVPSMTLHSEPAFTGGTTNTVTWSPVGVGNLYEVERSATADFAVPVSSGAISTVQHVFAGLADGQVYHYRGRVHANGVPGPWSPPVKSIQDASPPTVIFTPASGGLVIGDSLSLSGRGADQASGIASLTINGIAAASNDGFGEWQWQLSGLQDGLNTVEVVLRDQAVPPNSRTEVWTVNRIAQPAADTDRNGLSALLEYAFHSGGGDSAGAVLPRLTPAPDQSGLNFAFRRRLNATGLAYVVETSPNLTAWHAAGAEAQMLSVTPSGDGVTEVVSMVIHPPAGQAACFVRVRVAAQ